TAAVDGGLAWLVVLAVLNTVASLFYYLRVIAPVFTAPDNDHDGTADPVDREGSGTRSRPWARWTALGTAAVSLLLGVGAGAVLAVVGTPT
ncbi:NADH-quinone oxidoreductase subunit N, partial [Pseudonocardia ammonioxydans]